MPLLGVPKPRITPNNLIKGIDPYESIDKIRRENSTFLDEYFSYNIILCGIKGSKVGITMQ